MRQSFLVINKENFKYNIRRIQEYVGNEMTLIPVIKASGYGTYVNKQLDLIKEFKIVAVALVDEAIEIRRLGYKGDILVLNQPCKEEIHDIIKYNISVGVCEEEFIKDLGLNAKKAKIHLELETGMGRTGIFYKDVDKYIDLIKQFTTLDLRGIYTHLSSADYDEQFTNNQINLFNQGAKKILDSFDSVKYIHCQASNGLLNYEDSICNSCRPGIIMYGYESSNSTFDNIDLKPIATLKSKISYLKEVEPGQSVSYGRTFIAKDNMRIATVGLGYADGIRRELSNNGEVVINGKKAPIIGKVCMDSFMVDVTNINCNVGDEVFIWDNNLVTLDDIANKCNTINYEILSGISSRVPRRFI